MKLFLKIFFILLFFIAFNVDSYSIVLHRDKRPKHNKNTTLGDFRDDDSSKSKKFNRSDKRNNNLRDYNPDKSSNKKRVKLSKRYKPKMIIFNLENFTDNPRNNYLVKLSAPGLAKKLKESRKFNVEHVDIYFASVKIDDYSKYIKLLKKTSGNYNADYIITGFVHKPSRSVSIECLIYVARSDSLLKVNAQGNNLGVEYNDMINELARKILGLLNKENEKLFKEGKGRYDGKIFKEGEYCYIGMTGYFSLFYARKISTSIGYMATGLLTWELAMFEKVRNTKVARDLAIFWTLDVGRVLVRYDVLNQGSGVVGQMFHHFWGGTMGLMYKLKIKNFFALDFGIGYGPMYSKTILSSNYQGIKTFLLPTSPVLSTSIDHYFLMRFNFNIIINKHVVFSFGISYHLIAFEPQLFNALAGSAGIGFKF